MLPRYSAASQVFDDAQETDIDEAIESLQVYNITR